MRQRLNALARNWLPLIPTELFEEFTVTRRFGFGRAHFIADPDLIREILRDTETYERPRTIKEVFEPLTDDSVLFANKAHRDRLNALTLNAFALKHVRDAAPAMEAEAARTATQIATMEDVPAISGALSHLVQHAMTEFLFSDAEAFEPAVVDDAIAAFSDITSARDLLRLSSLMPKRWRINQRPAVQRFKDEVDGLIAHRRGASDGGDALARLLQLEELFDDEQIRGAVLTSYYAGRKTTALAIAWALYLLAVDQTAQTRVREEAEAGSIDYARLVIDEALRLYPPLAAIPRRAAKKARLGPLQIRRGDAVLVPVHVVHRHERLWERPNDFVPERFAAKGSKIAYQYLAFGGGERYCPGAAFATQLAAVAVARLVREYAFSLPKDWSPQVVFMLTLRVKGGMKLVVKRHGT
ncbi:MAG: cytochrome P450 [Pseudomonadota bacterium]